MAVDDGLTAIGGGRHGQRPVLRVLMACIARRERSRLPVAHKDRPCRCGLDGCAYFAETHDCEIRVVHTFSGRPACAATGRGSGKPPPMAGKVTRILHSQGLNRAKYDRLADLAARAGQVCADAWHRCRGLSTAAQTPYAIRDAWMAEGCAWHGLPARLGKATLADALGDMAAAKVLVGKAIRYRTRGNDAERQRLDSLLK